MARTGDAKRKTHREYLAEATVEELLAELTDRRRDALLDCTILEIETELAKRQGMDRDPPPKYVEK